MTIKIELTSLCESIQKLDLNNIDAFEIEKLSMKLTSLVERIYLNQDACSPSDLQMLKQHSQRLLDSAVVQKDTLRNKIVNLQHNSKSNVTYINNMRK